MFKILIDVNVFEDVLRKRAGWENSKDVIELVDKGYLEGWISSMTKVILYFWGIRRSGEMGARKDSFDITISFNEIPLRSSINSKACSSNLPEFEDNIQIQSALEFSLDAIITRNKKHFQQDEIPVYIPEEFLEKYQAGEFATKDVPYVVINKQTRSIYNEVEKPISDVLLHGMYVLGNEVREFERMFADYCQVKYAIGLNSGTDALILAMKALDIGNNDEVITVPNSFLATASSIVLTGAKPVFVDVCHDYNMDPELIEPAITERTKAILPVHLTGRPADITPIMEIAKKHNLYVIEDCAQAIGAKYKDKRVGGFGDIGCFSLHPLKNLNALGDGGVITTDREDIYEYLLKARNHGLRNRDECDFWSYNSRLDTIQAAVLKVKMKYIDEWTEKRRLNAAHYINNLKDIVKVPVEKEYERSVYHTFVIQAERRDELKGFLASKGIDTKIHYPIPIHLQAAAHSLAYKEGDFPVAEQQAYRILSLPMYPELMQEHLEYVVSVIREFYYAG
ncbi:MAG: DegT/DnrJ/EryC1/StrS family aminotransferase [Candidatus Poribacteria bacterium]